MSLLTSQLVRGKEWRPDANSFPSAVIGSEMDDWGGRGG